MEPTDRQPAAEKPEPKRRTEKKNRKERNWKRELGLPKNRDDDCNRGEAKVSERSFDL